MLSRRRTASRRSDSPRRFSTRSARGYLRSLHIVRSRSCGFRRRAGHDRILSLRIRLLPCGLSMEVSVRTRSRRRSFRNPQSPSS
jgi:hypothetical protein